MMGTSKSVFGRGILIGSLLLAGLFVLFSSQAHLASADTGWWNSNWHYRRAITISHDNIDNDLDNFPVTVFLDNTNFNFSNVSFENGQDLRFVDLYNTELDYEIEEFSKSGENGIIHVRIPSVSSTTDTTFYMYYGNASASDGQNPNGVWDDNYMAVWHLRDNTDSTTNANDGTAEGGVTIGGATGKIDNATDFDGTDDDVNCGDFGPPTNLTLEAWIKRDVTGAKHPIISKGDTSSWSTMEYRIQIQSTDTVQFGVTGSSYFETTDTIDTNWHYVVGTFDGNNEKIYIDGIENASDTQSLTITDRSESLLIGYSDTYFDGIIDEVRISNVARSAAWIKASYHSGNNTLLSMGSEESVSAQWLSGWDYRAPITLNTNENVPENYQYKIVLDKVDNLNNHCLDNFQDVRFTENEDGPELSFWIENYISGDNAIFWVRREDNSLSDNQIYVYYGNSGAASVENGDATFILFDHFEGTSLDGDKWLQTGDGGSVSVSNSIVSVNAAASYVTRGVHSQSAYYYNPGTDKIAYRGRLKTTTGNPNVLLRFAIGDSYYGGSMTLYTTYSAGTGYVALRTPGTYGTTDFNDVTNWHIYETRTTASATAYLYIDDILKKTVTDAPANSRPLAVVGVDSYTSSTPITNSADWVLVRKYTDPEPTASVGSEEQPGGGWLSGWGSRKKATVVGTTAGAQTNYQMKMIVHKGSGTDSTTDVYCGGNCRDDFGDIRWTASDGTTLLDYWIETYVSGDYAIFWIKIPSILASPGAVNIYMYYYAPTQTSLSDGDATFEFFDDFLGTSVDASKWGTWTNNNGSIVVSDSILELKSPDVSYYNEATVSTVGIQKWCQNVRLVFRANINGKDGEHGFSNVVTGSSPTTGVFFWNTNSRVFTGNGSNWEFVDSQYTKGAWHTFEIIWMPTYTKFFIDGTLKVTHTNYVPQVELAIAHHINTNTVASDYVDLTFLTKYVDPEPTWEAWGSEESMVSDKPTNLLCEGQTNPIHILNFTPEFSAIGINNQGDQMNYYALQVDDDSGFGSPIWDQPKTAITAFDNGTRCQDITYAGSALSRGTTYYWRIKFWDVNGYEGYWSTETAYFNINSLPTAADLKVNGLASPARLLSTTTTVTFGWTYTDADGDPQAEYEIWVGTSSGSSDMWNSGQISSSAASVQYAGSALSPGVTYYIQVRTYDNYEWSDWAAGTFMINRLPTAPTSLTLNVPKVGETLTTAASGSSDPDGDTIAYYYRFYNQTDGVERKAYSTSNTYTIAQADAHDNIKVFVKAWDGCEYSQEFENSIIVANTVPTVGLKTEGQTNPTRLTTFAPVFSWTYSDTDGDTQAKYEIWVGTVSGGSDMWSSGQVLSSATSIVYAGSSLSRGVTYYVQVRTYDGYEWPSWVTGTFRINQLSVTSNMLTEEQANPTRLTTFTPTFSWTYSDPDTDAQTKYEIWVGTTDGGSDMWNSGQVASSTTLVTYGGSALSRGVTYCMQIRTSDGYEWSAWSKGTFRLNQLSTISNLAAGVQPESIYADAADEKTCSSISPNKLVTITLENIDKKTFYLTVLTEHRGVYSWLVRLP